MMLGSTIRPLTWFVACLVLAGGCASARAEPPSRPGPEADADEEGPRPFGEVVTADLATDSGVVIVHRTSNELLFEVPDSLFGRDMLLVSRIARVPSELGGYIPAGYKAQQQVLVWERMGDRVLLRKRSYEQVAADSLPIAQSVLSNNFAPIVAAFEVEAEGRSGESVVVDVTEFFEGDTPALAGIDAEQRREYGVRSLDEDRSFINYARAYPLNVDVRHTLTYAATSPPSDENTGTLSMEMHQSMVLLPAVPMRPRYADPRVGYFSVEQVNYGLPVQKAGTQTYIRRWRLEPSDPAAYARGEVVEPVKPIIYYLDPATPTEWRACVRQGIEDWQAAFETAGFRNAIVARDAPAAAEDSTWAAGDVRYSVVRWAASLTRNAQGPSVSDPRSGEIIESDIVWYHNHMRSYRNRIMLETGATNPAARGLPIDYDLMCEAMRNVIAHEVGHALGLPHNMVSSSAYPVDSLRSASFADRMGVAPSIMDYARQNYIAQPGDGLEGDDFIRQIGPYDHYAINWGYRVLSDAGTPEAERPTLNRWILEHADDPVYRFLPRTAATSMDPRAQTEDLGADHVEASRYGIANLKRVTPRLVAWTTTPGEDYTALAELYDELLGQWYRYVNHVANVVGGVYVTLKSADQDGAVYDPVPRARQERALDFLAEYVFEAPVWLNHPEILGLIGRQAGGFEQLSSLQARVLGSLLEPRLLARVAELEASGVPDAYPLAALLDDVEAVVWLDPAATSRDPYRRALQRAHVGDLAALMIEEPEEGQDDGPDISRSDIRPLVRQQLEELRAEATVAAARVGDGVARAHLLDIAERVQRVLDPQA
ncbi:MAG: zinc-dependent metalloprotease [Longimicrobiales bacterium]